MKQPGNTGFSERRQASIDAKKLLLQKFQAAPKPDDPEMIAKRAERQAIAEAREARHAERERLKREKREREAQEAAAKKAEEAAKAAAEAPVVMTEAERKAERDRKYAARKARKR